MAPGKRVNRRRYATELRCEVWALCVTLSLSLYRPPCNQQRAEGRLGALAHRSEWASLQADRVNEKMMQWKNSAPIKPRRRTFLFSLPLHGQKQQDVTRWLACWPADVHRMILFLEPHCFNRLTAFKYGLNPFIVFDSCWTVGHLKVSFGSF